MYWRRYLIYHRYIKVAIVPPSFVPSFTPRANLGFSVENRFNASQWQSVFEAGRPIGVGWFDEVIDGKGVNGGRRVTHAVEQLTHQPATKWEEVYAFYNRFRQFILNGYERQYPLRGNCFILSLTRVHPPILGQPQCLKWGC